MEYSLVFTMYSTIFLIMLFVTFFSKKKNKTVRVKMYTAVLCFTFLFALFSTFSSDDRSERLLLRAAS